MARTLADGQLAAAAATLLTATGSVAGVPASGHVTVTCFNTSATLSETVVLTFQRGGGTARRVARGVLAPNEGLVVTGLQMDSGDVLQGVTTDASTVDYLVTDGGSSGFAVYALDANGVPKSQTANTTLAAAPAGVFPKNLLDGGDYTTNPWQRGTSTTGITSTATYGPDRWFAVGGASSSIGLSQNTSDTSIAGFSTSLKYNRASGNTNTAALKLGQVCETNDSVRLQGQQVTFSFWAKSGANYSGGTLTVKLNCGTGTDDTAAHMIAGSWAGQTTAISTTQAITSTMTRYSFSGTVPSNATQVGVEIDWTPTGTAGADDSVYYNGFQLELGGAATAFEHRDVEVELALCQRYFYQINEPGSGVIVGPGMITAAAVQSFILPMPTQMRAAPTVTVSVGTFKVNLAGSATTPTTFAAGTTHTPNYITVTSANTAQTAGQATLLQGGGGAGTIQASADY